MKKQKLKAPFPYFGGKSRVAALVWDRLGDVANYIEPFAGSCAVLLSRPHAPRIETINDIDPYVANFWRATEHDPDLVASFSDGPVIETNLHARHRWLVLSDDAVTFRENMRRDPDYYDAKIAGWWCWGLCCWIGGGWCSDTGGTISGDRQDRRPGIGQDGWGINCQPPVMNGDESLPNLSGDSGAAGRGIHASAGHKKRPILGDGKGTGGERGVNKRPLLGGRSERDNGRGVHRVTKDLQQKRPIVTGAGYGPGVNQLGEMSDGNRPQLADAFSRGRGVHGNDAAGTCEQRLRWLLYWFGCLRDRFRPVRVCCGQWLRVCDSPSVTVRLGVTGVLLDPPYPIHAPDGTVSRDANLYASDVSGTTSTDHIRDEVLAWCIERGADPMMRIAVCAYDTDGYEFLVENCGWTSIAWKAQGGYGNRSVKGKQNAERERIYFSPHCVQPAETMPLFAGMES